MSPHHDVIIQSQSNLWGSSWCFKTLLFLLLSRNKAWSIFLENDCPLTCMRPSGLFHCSGSLEPEYSCHDRDWIMELPMEADILTFTGILTPENASVASCCSGSAGASVVAHGVALPLYRDCFLDLRLFNSPDLRRLVLCYCCQAWTLETVLGGNTALTRWWTARSIECRCETLEWMASSFFLLWEYFPVC